MRRVVRCVCGQEMRVPAEALYRYGACVACGTRIKITEDNSHLETDEMALPGNHSHPAGPPGPFGAESTDFALPHDNCSRCGRAFRGDWDRHNSAAGALCDLCARQAPAPQTPDLITGGIERVSEVVPVPTASFSVIRTERPRKKKPSKKEVLLFSGIAALIFAVILIFPVEDYMAEFFSVSEEDLTHEFGPVQRGILLGVDALVAIAYYVVLLFAALSFCDRLPAEDHFDNFKAITIAAAILCILSFIPFSILWQILLVSWLFRLDILHVPAFIIAGLVLMPLEWALHTLIYGMFVSMFVNFG